MNCGRGAKSKERKRERERERTKNDIRDEMGERRKIIQRWKTALKRQKKRKLLFPKRARVYETKIAVV